MNLYISVKTVIIVINNTKFIAKLPFTFTTIQELSKKINDKFGRVFTGSNRTMESAPTIPSDRAILFEITEVIIYPVKGNNANTRN